MKLDENKIAEIIRAVVKPMIDESLNTALEPINKRLDNIEKDISDIKKRLSIIEREATKHGWDLSQDDE